MKSCKFTSIENPDNDDDQLQKVQKLFMF